MSRENPRTPPVASMTRDQLPRQIRWMEELVSIQRAQVEHARECGHIDGPHRFQMEQDYLAALNRRLASLQMRRIELEVTAMGSFESKQLMDLNRLIEPSTSALIPAVDPSAVTAFNLAALFLPKRVLDEDLGDAMEQINTLVLAGSPRWHIWLKIITSILWACWSAVKSPSAITHKAKK